MFNFVLLVVVEYFPIKMRTYGITSFECKVMVPLDTGVLEKIQILENYDLSAPYMFK